MTILIQITEDDIISGVRSCSRTCALARGMSRAFGFPVAVGVHFGCTVWAKAVGSKSAYVWHKVSEDMHKYRVAFDYDDKVSPTEFEYELPPSFSSKGNHEHQQLGQFPGQ
jgi:hypothetical protein